ncbi:MAG: glycoside hydrolase family 5 protein, partial [Fibrobacter sp.]|nr:glycoside hydrolase family 5 protein [Fibrobacter sp.]
MGVDEAFSANAGYYFDKKEYYQNMMNEVVQAAIDNDIYVIIDYHSHCAETNTSGAAEFFEYMAKTWGKYDNVIFEIYNEPKFGNCKDDTWQDLNGARTYWTNGIAPYAKTILQTIRKYSDNLVLVGTPYFDQYTNAALAAPLSDGNVAYTFHYYAGDDQYAHSIDNQGANAVAAMNGGLSVFVSEWGNSAPSGNGGFNASNSDKWYKWMKNNNLSGANWAVSAKNETASYFTTAGAWNYSESGRWVNANVFNSLPSSYTACTSNPTSSSSSESSSSSSKVRTVFELTNGNVPQTVTAGDEISPIVYRYENLTKVSAAVLSGLS